MNEKWRERQLVEMAWLLTEQINPSQMPGWLWCQVIINYKNLPMEEEGEE